MPKVFVPKENQAGETRVAATAETVKAFIKAGLEVVVQADAGRASHILDAAFADAGARLTSAPEIEWAQADMIRDRLVELGVAVEDTPHGATWERRRA